MNRATYEELHRLRKAAEGAAQALRRAMLSHVDEAPVRPGDMLREAGREPLLVTAVRLSLVHGEFRWSIEGEAEDGITYVAGNVVEVRE